MATAVPRTGMGTAMGMGGIVGRAGIPEGKATATIYGLIREQKYADAVGLLNVELQNFPRSRAALSLLGYCYYYLQDFRAATQVSSRLRGSGHQPVLGACEVTCVREEGALRRWWRACAGQQAFSSSCSR